MTPDIATAEEIVRKFFGILEGHPIPAEYQPLVDAIAKALWQVSG